MMEVYTPQAWLSIFGGCPSLVIDDKGYIYSADGYYKIFSDSPVGKIDFEKGYIYDGHYLDLFPTPIAWMNREGDVYKVREYGKGPFSDPILYIQGEKIYTPQEYLRIFGGTPSGYIKNNGSSYSGGSSSTGSSPAGSKTTPAASGGGGGGDFMTMLLFIPMLFIIGGLVYILSDESRLANATSVLALIVDAAAVVAAIYRLLTGKIHLSWDGKRFLKAFLVGFGVYFAATALFVLLGLGSNLGTGHSLSDAGGDQLELSAMLIGLPFVIEGFFGKGPKKKEAQTYTPSAQTYTPPKQAYTPPKQTYTPPAQTYTPPVLSAKEVVRRVMVQEFGERAVFPDALIGRNTADKVDFLLRVEGCPVRVFMILPDAATTQAYQNAQRIGMLWQNRGAYWHIVYERDCRDPAYVRQWLHSALKNVIKR